MHEMSVFILRRLYGTEGISNGAVFFSSAFLQESLDLPADI